MKLIISSAVRNKLSGKIPPVAEDEIIQCFANRTGKFLIDTRESNLTNPLTRWFIAETDFGRKLKVAFMPIQEGIIIKTAYDPNAEELCIYAKHGTEDGTMSTIDDNEAWESGQLGKDEAHVAALPESRADELAINEALGLQAISIRLEKSLIEDFKMIAALHGMGYQPLMRQALKRFADCEKNRILREVATERAARNLESKAAAKPPKQKERKAA